jgi:hypothetical protein
MLRVIMVQSTVVDKATASKHKQATNDHFANSSYDINEKDVSDGENPDGDITLGLNVKFNSTSDNEDFWTWLKAYIQDNSADFNSFRMTNHDCQHNQNGNLPCEIGDVWRL